MGRVLRGQVLLLPCAQDLAAALLQARRGCKISAGYQEQ